MSANLCEHCTAACCHYVALPIDTPESHDEFEDIRWYLIHENISVFVEDGEWFISMHTPCQHLQPDFRCGIYETRPRICRAYTTDNCDYHSGDYGWEQHFTTPEHLEAYMIEHDIRPKGGRKAGGKRSKVKAVPGRRRPSRRSSDPQTDRRGHVLPVLPTIAGRPAD